MVFDAVVHAVVVLEGDVVEFRWLRTFFADCYVQLVWDREPVFSTNLAHCSMARNQKRRRQSADSSEGYIPQTRTYQTRIAVYEGIDRAVGDAT